jgi:glycosyltransferase involved in cell wall biosynthesis
MPPLELMSCGIPTLITSYSGPRDYCNISNSLIIKHKLEYVDEKLSFLLGIGCRNFFFLSGYKNRPVWAVPEIDSISDSLQWMYKVPHLRDDLHYKGRQTASNMTWENSALQLSKILEKLL